MSSAPEVGVVSVSNVFIRYMKFQNGDVEKTHKHPFDHVTFLSSGRATVYVLADNGESVGTEYVAPAAIFIRKNREHRIESLEDGTVACCIHALRNGEGVDDIIDPDSIPSDMIFSASHLKGAKSLVCEKI